MDYRLVRKQEKAISERALKMWGVKAQLDKAIQEAAELTVAISKYDERRDVRSKSDLMGEMADCSVMIDQLRVICELSDDQWLALRFERWEHIIKRIEEEEGGNEPTVDPKG